MILDKWSLSMEPEDRKTFLSDDDRWAALVKRDQRAGGKFVYGVLTTGVYCLPACLRLSLAEPQECAFLQD
jgi:AraC family transcriptional regulator of adaptative response/methylated-DNA-[protein]-cysteine methyltransferase